MAYGQIRQNVAVAGNGTALAAHNLGSANFCAFLIQDATPPNVGPIASARVWMNTKTTTNVTVRNTAGAAPANNTTVDVLFVQPHSILDVGPIVTGATRLVTQVRRGQAPSYRSLHTAVPFTTGAPTVFAVHRLGASDVAAFIQPTGDPFDPGDGGLLGPSDLVFRLVGVIDVDTVELTCERTVDALPPSAGFNGITCDVMIISSSLVGSSYVFPPHEATVAGGGVLVGDLNDDYDGANAGRALPKRNIPSYWAKYKNCEIPFLVQKDVVHNLGGTPLMALVCAVRGPAVGGPYPYIVNRAVSATEIRMHSVAGNVREAHVLIMRSYSIVNLQ
jgi:hypothetical protein